MNIELKINWTINELSVIINYKLDRKYNIDNDLIEYWENNIY